MTGDDLLHVRDYLAIELMVSSYEHYWHLFIHQGYRTMLHLCSRITLCMDIRDLLEFQGSFKRYRV